MTPLDHLIHLHRGLATFETYLSQELSVPIEHCGDWKLYDLAEHLGGILRWVAIAIAEKRNDHQLPPAPRDAVDLAAWFHAASADLLTALDTDPATEAWTFFPPHTIGFWRRRVCLEVLVHGWDAGHALGIEAGIDPGLACDGVAEVFDTWAPRQVQRGLAKDPQHAVRFNATDTGTSWLFGPGEPVASISAASPVLLLMLWERLPRDDQAITWEGDRKAAQAALAGPLVP